MNKNRTSLQLYSKKIISIVCLTNIPVILFLPSIYSQAIGWITGTIASSANFYWLSINVGSVAGREPESSKLVSYKLFYLRYVALAVYSVIIVIVLKPDILVYGLGLISVQLTIFGYHLYETIKGKNVKGNDGQ